MGETSIKVFLVVGCHRSATSLIAKGLHDNGVYMGERLLGPDSHNPHGHFEDQAAIKINEKVLKNAGGDWLNPPEERWILRANDSSIKGYVEKRMAEGHEMWGLKDPRLCLTWPLWKRHLAGVDLHWIKVVRGGEEIARSLVERNKISTQKALELARIYQERMP